MKIFSSKEMNNTLTKFGFRAYELRQDSSLQRLFYGLFISLILHASTVFWSTEIPHAQMESRHFDRQPLQLSLNSPQQPPALPQPKSKTPDDLPALGPAIAAADEPPPVLFPFSHESEQVYFAPEDVEEMAFVVDVEELPLPSSEQTPNGALYLKILISESGSADRIDIMASTLPDDYAATLVSSFYQARFSPARTSGLPVRSWRIIEIRFGDTEPTSS